MGKQLKSALILVAIITLIVVIWIINPYGRNTVPQEYNLNDNYLQITTDKDVYEKGEIVTITAKNEFNNTLRVFYSGCQGNAFGISKYEDGWSDFPAGCGFCAAQVVNEVFEPGEIGEYEWDQSVYLDAADCGKKGVLDSGTYRVYMIIKGGPWITSYSPAFEIL